MKNIFLLISITVALGSCDKDRDTDHAKETPDSNQRVRRLERPPGESQGTRGRLRASLEAAKELQDPEERGRAITEVGWNALESAPDIAAEAIRELPAGWAQTTELIQSCVPHLMMRSPDAASAWSDSLRDPSLVAMARDQIAITVAETEPQRAMQLLGDYNRAGGESDQAMVQVLQIWTVKAPEEAAVWASRLPAGESRNTRIKTIVSTWLLSDPAASTAWVASLREPNLRLESTRFMVESLQGYPSFIRESMLESADSGIRDEIERQIELQQPTQEDGIVPEN